MRVSVLLALVVVLSVCASGVLGVNEGLRVEGEGSACSFKGKTGHCSSSPCDGTAVSGQCAGPATIQCCISTTAPNAVAPGARPAAGHDLPQIGARCTAFGAVGTCRPQAECGEATGRWYSGFCGGLASTRCCVPRATRTRYTPKQLAAINRAKAERLAEAEHKAKWDRFKQVNKKRFSSPAVEAQRYAQFKANRARIVDRNDRSGGGQAVFKSTSPFADVAPEVFKQKFLNLHKPAISKRSFIDISASLLEQKAEEFTQSALQTEEEEVTTSLLEVEAEAEADSQLDADIDAEADLEDTLSSEADAESDVSMVVDADSQALAEMEGRSFVMAACVVPGKGTGMCQLKTTCKGTVYSGLCPGAANIACCLAAAGPVSPVPAGPVSPVPAGPVSPVPAGPVSPIRPGTTPANSADVQPADRHVPGTMTIDFRNLMSPMKNQDQCGSCWAHAATEVYQAQGVRAGKWKAGVEFSVQQVMDCTTQAMGASKNPCDGGQPLAGLEFYSKSAGVYQADYPYTNKGGKCQPKTPHGAIIKQHNYVFPYGTGSQALLRAALTKYGPMVVAVAASGWQNYDGGILPESECPGEPDHAVALVGYGSEIVKGVAKPYWLLKNSWSADWGEAGYIRIQADSKHACSICDSPAFGTF